jgi:hypothetical protein
VVLGRWRRTSDALPGGRGIPAAPDDPAAGRRRRGRRDRPEPPALVEIPVGTDRFAAGALVARLEAEGIAVRLLTTDDHGLFPAGARRFPHRILIRADDEERVRAHIERTR